MSGRDEGYYGPSDYDVGVGCVSALIAVLGIPLLIALVILAFQGDASQHEPSCQSESFAGSVSDIPINAGDERAMHAVGLPTKADVLEWHETGRWGYGRFEGDEWVVRAFDELPDGAAFWDGVYGLDNADPAFRFR
ncbi:MAG: hypothetical protein IJ087_12265 [Eggerthellaceae bacterium]|nr:hypothetical protein [Eggerthellaceae bacterium]